MKLHKFLTATAVFVAAASLGAQQLTATVSPNPALPGASILIQVKAAYSTLYTPSGCLVAGIRQGSPTGPSVAFSFCTLVPVAIPLCGSTTAPRSYTWNQIVTGGGFATPGDYFFEVQHSPVPFGPITTEFFGVRIEAAGSSATLSAPTPPAWGSFFPLSIAAPAYPNEIYAVALSGSTNVGIPTLQGPFIWLDNDPLFQLSFPNPIPPFVNFIATLDPAGNSGGVGILLPPAPPGFTCLPIHAQAAILTSTGAVVLSNGLSVTIM